MKLKDCVELKVVNNDCVVLKVKDDQRINLISLGCFNGDEDMLRLTRGKNVTCTVFYHNGNSSSWSWGSHGYTLVTDSTNKAGKMIQNCIEKDFGIKCEY